MNFWKSEDSFWISILDVHPPWGNIDVWRLKTENWKLRRQQLSALCSSTVSTDLRSFTAILLFALHCCNYMPQKSHSMVSSCKRWFQWYLVAMDTCHLLMYQEPFPVPNRCESAYLLGVLALSDMWFDEGLWFVSTGYTLPLAVKRSSVLSTLSVEKCRV